MAINLDAFPPDVKLALISAGEEFSSDDTFAQATQTLQGLEKYADTLRAYGLPLSDTARLGEARDLLSESGYGRNQARSKKKTLGIGLDDANRAGRTARIRGRSILTSTKSALSEQGKTTFATEVQAALDATADSEKIGEDLAKQLDHLADAIDPARAPVVALAAADRGGQETLNPLRNAAAALREAVKRKPTVRGTPEETQRLDQIDGIILEICRRAREAAEAASKDLGDPAIRKAFKLDKLYASRSGGGKKEEAAPEGTASSPAQARDGKAP
jgi:predicted transcriptional regulator